MKHRPVKIWQDCPECGGTGFEYFGYSEYAIVEECKVCHGSGRVEADAPEPEFNKYEND